MRPFHVFDFPKTWTHFGSLREREPFANRSINKFSIHCRCLSHCGITVAQSLRGDAYIERHVNIDLQPGDMKPQAGQ